MELQAAVAVAALVIVALSVVVFLIVQRKGASKTASVSSKLISRASISEDPSKPRVRVLFGTQTGTAERFAKQIASEIRKKYGSSTTVDVTDIENYKARERLSQERLVIFCMATYGDGEPTDNAADFYSWLCKEADAVTTASAETTMKDVTYAVFGLGNRQYEHFNSVGKRIHSSMETLGAQPIVARGDGDDDGVIDDDFEKWSNSLYAAIDASGLVGGKASSDSVSIVLQPASYDVELLQPHATASSGVPLVQPFPVGGSGLDSHSPFWARVTEVHELHTERSDRSCVHAELDISGSQITYEAGDHIAIHAQNDPAVVLEMAALLGHSQDCVITLTKRPTEEMLLASSKQQLGVTAGSSLDAELPEPFPGPIALRSALAYFADVLASPRREALAVLAACATDPSEAARLGVLSSSTADGKATFAAYISKPKRSLLEVMREFPSARPTLGVFFASVAPRLQPRFYSISSSPAPFPRSVHVSCAVVRDVMPTGRVHDGICSSWLAKHAIGSSVPVFIRHSHFKLPASHTTPVVMVGPGTGVAPFRGFVQEREAAVASGTSLGPAHLFFGCRTHDTDFIYESELKAALTTGALSNLHVAFSRESDSKVYVQHHLEREGEVVWNLLDKQNASLFVCGDAKHMAKDVQRALVQVVMKHKPCNTAQAETWIKALTDAGRYQRDVW